MALDLLVPITSVRVQPSGAGTLLVFDAEGPIQPQVTRVAGSHRLVVDIPGGFLEPGALQVPSGPVGSVLRLEAVAAPSGAVQIAADLANVQSHELTVLRQGTQAIVEILGDVKARPRPWLVVIDPGHGGFDPGATSAKGNFEKDVTLDIGLRLADLLRAVGVEVRMTRSTDVYVGLRERAQIANDLNADLFVSIHANSHLSDAASGTETWVHQDQPQSRQLGTFLHRDLVRATGLTDRGIRFTRELAVLRHNRVPAALVEVAFMSTSSDEEKLMDPGFRQRVAEGLLSGILAFLNQVSTPNASSAGPQKEGPR